MLSEERYARMRHVAAEIHPLCEPFCVVVHEIDGATATRFGDAKGVGRERVGAKKPTPLTDTQQPNKNPASA